MTFENLSFPVRSNRPFFYTSFVQTLDGKIFVKHPGYWPIGSSNDYDYFTYLRAHADAIIDGKHTALTFGKATIDTLHKASFQTLRMQLGKKNAIEYIIATHNPDSVLTDAVKNSYGYTPTITNKTIDELITYTNEQAYKMVFIDGGPTLLRSFLEQTYLDEIFLTISPKIYAGKATEFLTMIEGELFSPADIKQFSLVSVKQVENEVFLRYRNNG